MPTRTVPRKPRQTQDRKQRRSKSLPDNVTEFPGPAGKRPASRRRAADTSEGTPSAASNETVARTIDAIADHVLAARYLSAEEHNEELNRLLDLVLLQIGRTIAEMDGPKAHGLSTH